MKRGMKKEKNSANGWKTVIKEADRRQRNKLLSLEEQQQHHSWLPGLASPPLLDTYQVCITSTRTQDKPRKLPNC